jgi:DNA mismatch repair protein MutS
MSGKSTVLRLAATTALLHQIGSYVPADSAELSLFDRIVCRMGAQDDLAGGQSTFFVEMREVGFVSHNHEFPSMQNWETYHIVKKTF